MTAYSNGNIGGTYEQVQNMYPHVLMPKNHPENWPDGPWVEIPSATPTPDQALARQRNIIRADAMAAYRNPVALDDGTVWNGGFDSALAINSAAEMAAFAGNTSVSIFDSSNVEHVVLIADAKTVAAQIGADYQIKFCAKQAAMRALSAVDLATADAIDQLNSIAFADFLPTT